MDLKPKEPIKVIRATAVQCPRCSSSNLSIHSNCTRCDESLYRAQERNEASRVRFLNSNL